MNEFGYIIENITQEYKNLTNLWDSENAQAVLFLKKIVSQAHECIWYTNQRLLAVRILWEAGPMGKDNPDALFSGGPEMAMKLTSDPITMMMGYLQVKNEMNGKRVFVAKLLEIILSFLIDKALQEGYRKPTMEPVE